MAERMTRRETWGYMTRALASAEVAYKGQVAAIDLSDGTLVPMSAATGLLAIGYFESNLTGDGTTTIQIRLFKELNLHRFSNAASGPVADDDVGNICYFSAAGEVSMTSTSRSIAGRVWAVTSAGVLVEPLISTSQFPIDAVV